MEQWADGIRAINIHWNWKISWIHGIVTVIEPISLIILFVLLKSVLSKPVPIIGEGLSHVGLIVFRVGIVNLWRGASSDTLG